MDAIRNIPYKNHYRKTSVLSINRVPDEDAVEPVELSEAKEQLRVDFDDEDTKITRLISAARKWAEDYTGLSLVETTVTVVIDNAKGNYQLPYGPFIDTFAAEDEDGNVIATDSYEIIAEGNSVFFSYSASGRTAISYKAGFAEVPEGLKQAILFYIEYLYDPSELGEKAKKKAENLAKGFKQRAWLI